MLRASRRWSPGRRPPRLPVRSPTPGSSGRRPPTTARTRHRSTRSAPNLPYPSCPDELAGETLPLVAVPAHEHLILLGALEQEVGVVRPGKADPSVDLDVVTRQPDCS